MEKYYTPEIEDIKVGYEYQEFIMGFDGELDSWSKKIVGIVLPNLNFHLLIINEDIKKGKIRTCYLTKEQIESEGWKELKNTSLDFKKNCFEKGNYFLIFYASRQLEIIMKDLVKDNYICHTSNGRLFTGKLKSINEFRTICKLLEIS